MRTHLPERQKKPGVCYALTDDGVELPVIDVTHPAFFLPKPTGDEVAGMVENAVREMEGHNRLPAWARRAFLWWFGRKSVLMRGLRGEKGGFLSGMNTYLMKLGPDNLGSAYSSRVDRAIAASPPAVSTRLRLQDTARLLADGLSPLLAARPNAPLHLINIAGGPCLDSLNALILLRADEPALVAGRALRIHALDLHSPGPSFGARALEALRVPGAPLSGLDAELHFTPYDWSEPGTLRAFLRGLPLAGAVAAASSEGGLLHYGTNADVAGNLLVLAQELPRDGVVVASFTRDDNPARAFDQAGNLRTIARSLDRIRALAGEQGWAVEECLTQVTSRVVRLRQAGVGAGT